MESWAQVLAFPYMARSQMTSPSVASTLVETSQSVTYSLRLKEWREPAGMGNPAGAGLLACEVMKVRSTVTWVSPGFCTSTQVSMPPWVQPSARYQVEMYQPGSGVIRISRSYPYSHIICSGSTLPFPAITEA
jgi:hypothetical protein